MKKGKVIIISAPSGAGKSTIRKKLMNNNSNLWTSISMTTRLPRENERDGVDYFFVSKDEFIDNIKHDNFLEYAEVYNNIFYGTPKNKINEMLDKGFDCILEIDVEGALNAKKVYQDAITIFIMPPSMEVLEKRLRDRNTDSDDKVKERLKKSLKEISFKDQYDYIVINDDLDIAVKECEKIINEC